MLELSDLPKSRSGAIDLKSTFYFTGRPCKHGHLDKRHVRDGCRSCCREKEKAKRRTPEGRARHKEHTKRWRKTESGRESRAASKARQMERIKSDPVLLENFRKKESERSRRYFQTPIGKAVQRRHSIKKEEKVRFATPKWTDSSAVNSFIDACPSDFHIDHILPLRGESICGLHVLENLQYLPAKENLKKSNKVIPITLEYAVCPIPTIGTIV